DRKLRVYFGTGRLMIENDKFNPTADNNAFYCIVMKQDKKGIYYPTVANDPVVDITAYDTKDKLQGAYGGEKGVYNTFSKKGANWKFSFGELALKERIVTDPTCVAGVVLFTSFNPKDPFSSRLCGASKLYAVDYITGVEATHRGMPVIVFDKGKEGAESREAVEHSEHPRYADLAGDGIAWAPQVVHSTDASKPGTSVVIRNADGTTPLQVIPLNINNKTMWLKTWKRE
ncbi:MAG: hypothetical protein V1753_05000, partial [Pseudomonadota bacterium]